MPNKVLLPRRKRKKRGDPSKKKVLNRLVENGLIDRVSSHEYREKVRDVYSGPKGALLTTASVLSLHLPLGERLFRERRFDLRGARSILDVGSGAGQIARHLLKYSDPGTRITCFDLSLEMLCRARNRLKSGIPKPVVGDLGSLPFADGSFDCVTCGYVLEYLPEAKPGLAELARVMVPGGRMLLLATEDSFCGAWTSRLWYCRTYNRKEIHDCCSKVGLAWKNELWFSRMHRAFRAGGICVELQKK